MVSIPSDHSCGGSKLRILTLLDILSQRSNIRTHDLIKLEEIRIFYLSALEGFINILFCQFQLMNVLYGINKYYIDI
jgi:hypothetical protein